MSFFATFLDSLLEIANSKSYNRAIETIRITQSINGQHAEGKISFSRKNVEKVVLDLKKWVNMDYEV
ncbi:hypothetical protein A3844_01475 [Paenibacillus helianthi]|uniref:Uncharacterized protein n=1 Tax=Paenibacillus helianthi TaxID=1349432 RepID=A0ABX3EVF8_9BACL|nr:hypothetical protein A3844_01475 [Paenibacillus helianthi]OKP94150.1 hypothetical protein A3848_03770 [Paenibacillus sp. P32E]